MRYNGGMIETTLPLAPEPGATVSVPESVSLLEQLATLQSENAALRAVARRGIFSPVRAR
jgi:hypothetical protein